MRTSFATLKRTMFAPREEGTMSANDGRESSRWAGLAVLTLPVLLTSMDITILHIAIPKITHDLTPTASQTLWILDAYGFLLARSEEHTSELQSRFDLVCRLLLEKQNA